MYKSKRVFSKESEEEEDFLQCQQITDPERSESYCFLSFSSSVFGLWQCLKAIVWFKWP